MEDKGRRFRPKNPTIYTSNTIASESHVGCPLFMWVPLRTSLLLLQGWCADIAKMCGFRPSVLLCSCKWLGYPDYISVCLLLVGGIIAASQPHFQIHFVANTHSQLTLFLILSLSHSHTQELLGSRCCMLAFFTGGQTHKTNTKSGKGKKLFHMRVTESGAGHV